MDLALESINGLHNRRVVIKEGMWRVEQETTGWTTLIGAIGEAHAEGDITFPVDPDDAKKVFMTISREDETKENKRGNPATVSGNVAQARKLLDLRALQTKFEIKFGPYAYKNDEIVVRTRSVIRAMQALSEYVEVPACHLAEGRARYIEGAGLDDDPLLKVHSGVQKPCDAFAAVQYQGYWFWVDQCDTAHSKSSMIQLRTLMALADTGDRPPSPALVIPTK